MLNVGILQPLVALTIWTMVMWWWMYATRLPAGAGGKLDPEKVRNAGPAILDELLPPETQRKAHNYNHLHEAPTVFYAVALVLAIVGAGDGLAAQLGWAYVVLRVLHSIVQSTINKVELRFVLFALSSFVLMALVGMAAKAVF